MPSSRHRHRPHRISVLLPDEPRPRHSHPAAAKVRARPHSPGGVHPPTGSADTYQGVDRSSLGSLMLAQRRSACSLKSVRAPADRSQNIPAIAIGAGITALLAPEAADVMSCDHAIPQEQLPKDTKRGTCCLDHRNMFMEGLTSRGGISNKQKATRQHPKVGTTVIPGDSTASRGQQSNHKGFERDTKDRGRSLGLGPGSRGSGVQHNTVFYVSACFGPTLSSPLGSPASPKVNSSEKTSNRVKCQLGNKVLEPLPAQPSKLG